MRKKRKFAAKQGIVLGKLDYKRHRATPTRTDPLDGIRFTMSFKPEVKRGPGDLLQVGC
jgi:hypothetical protein